jgi:ABC-type branched-subunit amino acid transport system ATPase component
MDGQGLLQVAALSKRYGDQLALGDVSFDVRGGEVLGLIGPNGAGKTTLFNCISGVVAPDSGTVIFAGRDITGWRPDRISSVGLSPQKAVQVMS